MSDEAPSKSRFKSKWGKVFKGDETGGPGGGKNKFALNEDVVDFLKPSTERYSGAGTRPSTNPKIDVATAQRWPDAADVKRAAVLQQGLPPPLPLTLRGKTKRRKDLVVRFVQTAPEIIGEGGDEAEAPALEISQRKTNIGRSFSERRPSVVPEYASGPSVQHMRPGMVQRAQTHDRYSNQPPVVRLNREPEELREQILRPGISRTATGFDGQNNSEDLTSSDQNDGSHEELNYRSGQDDHMHVQQHQDKQGQPKPRHERMPATEMIEQRMRQEEGLVLRSKVDSAKDLVSSRPVSRSKDVHPTGSSQPQQPLQDFRPNSSSRPYQAFHTESQFSAAPHRERDFDVASHAAHTAPSRDQSHSPYRPAQYAPGIERAANYPQSSGQPVNQHNHTSPTHLSPDGNSPHSWSQPPPSPRNLAQPMPPTNSRHPSPTYFTYRGPSPAPPSPSLSQDGHSSAEARKAQDQSSPRSIHTFTSISPAKSAALEDFASRVEHMKGVFSLTAEKQIPGREILPRQWIRCALWWYLQGRTGLQSLARRQARSKDQREMLLQPHVDVAKAWWILADILGIDMSQDITSETSMDVRDPSTIATSTLRNSLTSLASWMHDEHVMPPYQSLIQGQDTTIWTPYPQFSPDVAYLLGGNGKVSGALESLPIGDTRSMFFYNRMLVNVAVNTDNPRTDRVNLPCMLSILRSPVSYQTTIAISSHNELVNIRVTPSDDQTNAKGLTWHDVSWKSRSHGLYVSLPHGYILNVQLEERDFITLSNMAEYTKRMSSSFDPRQDEQLVYKERVVDVQYADNSKTPSFPKDKIKGCYVGIFEKTAIDLLGSVSRRVHRGHRVTLVTPPTCRTLSAISHDYVETSPIVYEALDGSQGNEKSALVLHAREQGLNCSMALVFRDAVERGRLLGVLNGSALGDGESYVANIPLQSYTVESLQTTGGHDKSLAVTQGIRWQNAVVIHKLLREPVPGSAKTVLSESHRLVLEHTSGQFADCLNLGPGELMIRAPVGNQPSIQVLRLPQKDMTIMTDARKDKSNSLELLRDVQNAVNTKASIRTLTFGSYSGLHNFQRAVTSHEVLFDGLASHFTITRHRMVISIQKKVEATATRIQVLSHGNHTQLMASFEGFAHADAMIFQIKSSDTFEKVKGDKGSKHSVKLVEAKFTLPKERPDEPEGESPLAGAIDWPTRRKFVNTEGLEYAEEHDDITISFDHEQDYENFCKALPAPVTMGRAFTLKRRI